MDNLNALPLNLKKHGSFIRKDNKILMNLKL